MHRDVVADERWSYVCHVVWYCEFIVTRTRLQKGHCVILRPLASHMPGLCDRLPAYFPDGELPIEKAHERAPLSVRYQSLTDRSSGAKRSTFLDMKIRDSGMPAAETWETFFDPRSTLRQLSFDVEAEDVADLGCGYGTFSVAAAQLTRGTVYAIDLERDMVAATSAKARQHGLSNVAAIERDFVLHGTGLPDDSMAYVMLFNILHAEDALSLLREAFRVLRKDGTAAIIHWIYDSSTPRGPDLSIRPRPEQCLAWAADAGLVPESTVISLPPYHYGVIARKPKL